MVTKAARTIATLKTELQVRLRIYKAWIASLDFEGPESLVPYLEEYPVFYFQLKRAGICLPGEIERRLVGAAQAIGPGGVSVREVKLLEVAGGLEEVHPKFAAWLVAAWGRLACREIFARFGVDSAKLAGALELQLLVGPGHDVLDPAARERIALLIGERSLEEVLDQGLATRAELFSFVSDIAKADALAA